jgi:hypothetical protein
MNIFQNKDTALSAASLEKKNEKKKEKKNGEKIMLQRIHKT